MKQKNIEIAESIAKDPRGLIKQDVAHLLSVFKPKPITPKMTMAEIQHAAGQQLVINYIINRMIAKADSRVLPNAFQ